MKRAKLLAGATAMMMLAACEAKIGKGDSAKDEAATESAEAKTDGGSFSIDVPGFEMKLNIPDDWKDNANIDSDSDIFPPGAKMRGVHIRAGRAGGEDGVELRFTSPDAPAKVAEWYRDGARSEKLTVASVTEQGGVFTVTGTDKDDGDPFSVQLGRAGEGGTDGRITFTDRN